MSLPRLTLSRRWLKAGLPAGKHSATGCPATWVADAASDPPRRDRACAGSRARPAAADRRAASLDTRWTARSHCNGRDGNRALLPACSFLTNLAGLSGSLAERGVSKLLFDLMDGSQTGTLALARGKVRKEIYVRDGRIVAADSNLRQEALGTLLCSKGIIDERQLAYLLAETKARGHKMGAVLIELGWLSPDEVLQCLAAQTRKRISDCLRWDEGGWSLVPGDTFGDRVIEHQLDVERIIFMGLFRSTRPRSWSAALTKMGHARSS